MRNRLLIAAYAASFWPVWIWYASSTGAAEEPYGLLALATAALIVWRGKGSSSPHPQTLWPAAALALLYAALFGWAPPLARAGLAFAALASLAGALRLGRALDPGLWGLALLSLPLLPTLQFYAGYPLRAMVAALAAGALRGSGISVSAAGASLDWAGTTVLIDAPCSGLRMLWAGAYLCSTLAALWGLPPRKCVLAAGWTLAAVLGANVLRAASLFFLEAGIVNLPAWVHGGVGVVSFLFAGAAITPVVRRLAGAVRCA